MLKKNQKKPVDMLVGTKVNNGLLGEKREGFTNDEAHYLLLQDNHFESMLLSKEELASTILKRVLN